MNMAILGLSGALLRPPPGTGTSLDGRNISPWAVCVARFRISKDLARLSVRLAFETTMAVLAFSENLLGPLPGGGTNLDGRNISLSLCVARFLMSRDLARLSVVPTSGTTMAAPGLFVLGLASKPGNNCEGCNISPSLCAVQLLESRDLPRLSAILTSGMTITELGLWEDLLGPLPGDGTNFDGQNISTLLLGAQCLTSTFCM
mmetsp:Transcript_107900/g.196791  ORF Transcript_107900/g.196791 Transcript_107900/m.196791 type:complete len:203 (+) Transcript_107900:129-737(+)